MTLKDNSLGLRIWRTLSDRTRIPRKWWNPIIPYRRLSRSVLVEAYKQYAETTNRAMLALLVVCTFCVLTAVSTPDKTLLAPEGTIKVPFAEASISFLGFVSVAPVLVIVVAVYLHIFYGYWLYAEHERREYNTRLPEADKTEIEPVPMLFGLGDIVSRTVTAIISYWLPPVAVAAIAWKGAGLPLLAAPLRLVFFSVAAVLIILRIRRNSDGRSRFMRVLVWAVLAYVLFGAVDGIKTPERYRRALNLFRAELPAAYLAGQDLRQANLSLAKLKEASLRQANLEGAKLLFTDLQAVDLGGANLQAVDLRGANLQGTDLKGANLQGADLRGTDLQGVDLEGAQGLTKEQIDSAKTNKNTRLPDYLKPKPN